MLKYFILFLVFIIPFFTTNAQIIQGEKPVVYQFSIKNFPNGTKNELILYKSIDPILKCLRFNEKDIHVDTLCVFSESEDILLFSLIQKLVNSFHFEKDNQYFITDFPVFIELELIFGNRKLQIGILAEDLKDEQNKPFQALFDFIEKCKNTSK